MSSPLELPICTIQPDFTDVVNDVRGGTVPDEFFWLSCYKTGAASVHAKVHALLDDRDRDLVILRPSDGVQLTILGGRADARQARYTATCRALHVLETPLAVPAQSYSDPSPSDHRKSHQITAFDIAPDRSQFATAYSDGTIYLRSVSPFTSNSSVPLAPAYAHAKPHISTPTSLCFFPSSRVLLTAGLDFSLTILPADPPISSPVQPARVTPARVLKGHTRGITATAIVARGRNVLSASRDGTLRLWDISSAAQIRALSAGGGSFVPILSLSIGQRPAAPDAGTADVDPREVETDDKLVFLALHDGTFEVHDLRTKRAVLRVPAMPSVAGAPPLHAIAYDATHALLATGDARGAVRIHDVRIIGAGSARELGAVHRNEAAIEDLAWLPSSSPSGDNTASAMPALAIATSDGLPYILRVGADAFDVRAELVGVDCEPVPCVRALPAEGGSGVEVWSAAGDGVVRRYIL